MGKYRLVPELSKHSIDTLKSSYMTPDQRQFRVIKVLKITNNGVVRIKYAVPSTCFSVPLEDCNP